MYSNSSSNCSGVPPPVCPRCTKFEIHSSSARSSQINVVTRGRTCLRTEPYIPSMIHEVASAASATSRSRSSRGRSPAKFGNQCRSSRWVIRYRCLAANSVASHDFPLPQLPMMKIRSIELSPVKGLVVNPAIMSGNTLAGDYGDVPVWADPDIKSSRISQLKRHLFF